MFIADNIGFVRQARRTGNRNAAVTFARDRRFLRLKLAIQLPGE